MLRHRREEARKGEIVARSKEGIEEDGGGTGKGGRGAKSE